MIPVPLQWLLGAALAGYVVLMYVVSWRAQRRIETSEDFLVAGRRLPLSLAWATLFATWFGAGTLLTQADEINREGIHRAALDPLGAGACLILAGLFLARPLWDMGLLTLADFFRRQYGVAAEVAAAMILVPSYFGWIAAQFVALALVLQAYFGLDVSLGILLVAGVGMGYTLLGGMWSVTLTDAIQMVLLLLGLVMLGVAVVDVLGQGGSLAVVTSLWQNERTGTEAVDSLAWLGAFAVGALGNLPGQDLTQRIFAAKSAKVARNACFVAGAMYLLFGSIPILLGLAARQLIPDVHDSVVATLAGVVLHPLPLLVFTLALVSAVLSTIDSAILSPASVLSQNLFAKLLGRKVRPLVLNRIAVVLVTLASVVLAYAGAGAYELLENAYALTLVGLLVPLVLGLWLPRCGIVPALAAMMVGTGVWLGHEWASWYVQRPVDFFLVLPMPSELTPLAATVTSLIAFACAHLLLQRKVGDDPNST